MTNFQIEVLSFVVAAALAVFLAYKNTFIRQRKNGTCRVRHYYGIAATLYSIFSGVAIYMVVVIVRLISNNYSFNLTCYDIDFIQLGIDSFIFGTIIWAIWMLAEFIIETKLTKIIIERDLY